MELYTYTEPYDYLEHHGIKGQRWGIRRYQNKDGSLKPAGEKHRSLRERRQETKAKKAQAKAAQELAAKRKAAADKARAAKAAKKQAEEKAAAKAAERRKKFEAGKIPMKKMTDAELAEATQRKKAEQAYKDQRLANSTGRRFVNKMVNDALIPAATNAAKDLAGAMLKKYGAQYLGLVDKPSAYEQMKQAHEMSKWKKEMQEDKEWFEDTAQRREVDRAKRDAEIAKNKKNERLDKDFLDNRDEELAERKAKRQAAEDNVKKAYDDYVNTKPKPDSSPYSKKGDQIPKDDLSDGKKYEVAIRNDSKKSTTPPKKSAESSSKSSTTTALTTTGKAYVSKQTSSNKKASSVPESHRISGKSYFENNGHKYAMNSDGVIDALDWKVID